jgi:poly(3-hydroxybutyrate) depolymerase
MHAIRIGSIILFNVITLWAQTPLVNPEAPRVTPQEQMSAMVARLEYRSGVQLMSRVVSGLRSASQASDELKAQVERLSLEATALQGEGKNGEARRRLWQAATILRGLPWNEREEYNGSLVLRVNLVVADISRLFIGRIAQVYPARYKPSGGLRLRVSLAEATSATALSAPTPSGKIIKEIGTYDLPIRDLIENPYLFEANMQGTTEGMYMLVGEVLDGGASFGRMVIPIHLVRDLEGRQNDIEKRLTKILGHESTKATIRYPFDLIRGINAGRREVLTFDVPYDIRRSEELLKALESGKEPLERAKGDNRRNYYFAEAGEILPYRVYVPTVWDGKKQLPMIVALHGGNLDENDFLTRGDGIMRKTAEQHGYVVVTPLGYRIGGGYGRALADWGPSVPVPSAPGSTRASTASTSTSLDAARLREAELSEKDVLNVMEIVAKEYNVDRSRIYLMGNSMGGGGTFYLASKYPHLWAGIAPSGSSMTNTGYPFDKLNAMPIMMVMGDLDNPKSARESVRLFKEHGLDVHYEEVKGGTHGTAIEIAMPKVFDFFDKNRRRVAQR